MALQGTLDTFALPDVLRLLDSTQKTGCLRLSGSRGSGRVWVDAGSVVGSEAPGVRDGADQVDVVFELLRFEDGSFTFEPDEEPHDRSAPRTVDVLLGDAEARLAEWRQIAEVVPSLECWVRLVPDLPGEELVISSARWRALVAVAAGTTVRHLGEELELAEVPVSRVVKDLLEAGLVEIEADPPTAELRPVVRSADEPLVVELPEAAVVPPDEESSVFEPIRFEGPSGPDGAETGRAEPVEARAPVSADDAFLREMFPGLTSDPGEDGGREDGGGDDEVTVEDTSAAANGGDAPSPQAPANGAGAPSPRALADDVDDPDLARQLGNLSPKAAAAVQAAAAASTEEEREAALDSAGDDETINRGLLLKFLGSVHN